MNINFELQKNRRIIVSIGNTKAVFGRVQPDKEYRKAEEIIATFRYVELVANNAGEDVVNDLKMMYLFFANETDKVGRILREMQVFLSHRHDYKFEKRYIRICNDLYNQVMASLHKHKGKK